MRSRSGWTFLARSHWGGEYNREMKRLMLDHAFRFVGRVVFLIDSANHRSQRATEKIGAVRAGTRYAPGISLRPKEQLRLAKRSRIFPATPRRHRCERRTERVVSCALNIWAGVVVEVSAIPTRDATTTRP